MASDSIESIFAHAGGEAGLRAIVADFYASIFTDPVLQPVFGQPVATHVDHLTAFFAEEFGGPSRCTSELGGYARIVAIHRRLQITETQRQRFIELFMAAVRRAGFTDDIRFTATIRSAVEFGTKVALVNSNAGTDDELFPLTSIPHWKWEDTQ